MLKIYNAKCRLGFYGSAFVGTVLLLHGCSFIRQRTAEFRRAEMERVDEKIHRCLDHACINDQLIQLSSLFDKEITGRGSLHKMVNGTPFQYDSHFFKISPKSEDRVYQFLVKIKNEQAYKHKKYGRTINPHVYCSHAQGEDLLYGTLHLNTIKVLGSRIAKLADDLISNCNKERVEVVADEKQRVLNEQRAKAAEAVAKKERDYANKYMDFTWKDSDTGERSGKAVLERERIRKYRSIGNNDMAQAFLKMYDEWGSIVLNPKTGHEYHEIRVNCDIYESSPDVIESGSRRYGMTGDVPKGICAAAGYPRR